MLKYLRNKNIYNACMVAYVVATILGCWLNPVVGVSIVGLGGFALMYWAYYISIGLPTRIMVENPDCCSGEQIEAKIREMENGVKQLVN